MKRLKKFTDKDLIEGLTSQDEKMIEQFYVLYYRTVRLLVVKNNGNNDDAKDIFQESLLVLYQKVRNRSFNIICSLKTYLYSVARILWLKELERRKKYTNQFFDNEQCIDLEYDILEIYEHNERLFLFRSFICQLSQNCQKVLNLLIEGRSLQEITRIMGYKNVQHTKNRCYRCKQALIKRIRNTYGYEELKYEKDGID